MNVRSHMRSLRGRVRRASPSTVRGWACGLGFQLALAADFTIASESACFWEPFTERGFSADSVS